MNNSSTKIYSQNREGKNINTAKKMLHPNLHPSPPKCSFQISTALMSSVSFCTSLSFVEICFFFYYFPKENDKHTVTLISGQPSLTSLQASCQKKKIECSTTEKNISRTPQERKKKCYKAIFVHHSESFTKSQRNCNLSSLAPF